MFLKCFEAESCCIVTTVAESETRFDVENYSAVCIVFILPDGTDEKLITDRKGLEICFPVVFPVLISADAQVDFVSDSFCIVTL